MKICQEYTDYKNHSDYQEYMNFEGRMVHNPGHHVRFAEVPSTGDSYFLSGRATTDKLLDKENKTRNKRGMGKGRFKPTEEELKILRTAIKNSSLTYQDAANFLGIKRTAIKDRCVRMASFADREEYNSFIKVFKEHSK